MSLKRNIIIFVAVVAVLAGLIFAVMKINPKEEENEQPESTAAPTYTAYKRDSADVERIVINNADEVLTLKNTDDGWSLNDISDEEVSASKLESLAGTILTVISGNELSYDSTRESEYGFDNPTVTVEVNLKSGEKDTLLIGEMSPTTGEYFFKTDGSDKVYTINAYKVDSLKNPVSYYQSFNRFSIESDAVTEMIFERRDKSTIHLKLKEEMEETSYDVWLMTEPYKGTMSAIDDYVDDNILTPISELNISNPAEGGGNYGFDSPAAVARFFVDEYNEKNGKTTNVEHKLTIGNTENHVTYVKIDNLDKVYTVDESAISFVFTDEFQLVSKLQGMAEIDGVSKVEITDHGRSTVIDVEHLENNQYAFKLNGEDADTKAAKKAYENIITVYVDDLYKNESLGDADVTVKYTGYGENEDVLIEYIPINELSYALRRNGETQFTVKKTAVDKMLEKLYEYEQNPTAEQ